MKCRVCEAESSHQFSQQILHKYTCAYFFCKQCGFLQTEDPYWLPEAYESAIANADTGLVFRNIYLSKIVSTLLFFLFNREGKYLDFAGGYGMLTRMLRDIGFDYYWTDLYCQNLLARGFDLESTEGPFAAITAFEVMEHVPHPVEFLTNAMKVADTRTVIFSTELFSDNSPPPDSWWYYTFATGQHIAFYQVRTLQFIARRLGLTCYSNGTIHMFTDQKVSSAAFRLLTHPRVAGILSQAPKRALESKMMSDHRDLVAKVL